MYLGQSQQPNVLSFASERQAVRPCFLGQRLDATVIGITSAIKYDAGNPGSFGALRQNLPDNLSRRNVAAALQRLANLCVNRRSGDKRATPGVINDLGINVFQRPKHIQPGRRREAAYPATNPPVDSLAAKIL